jgi:predicted nucleic acid-binding protein
MLVVSNTSPLSNLAIIDRLDLLREQLGSVTIPPGVRTELSRNPHPAAISALEKALEGHWLSVVPLIAAVPDDLASALDVGEAEALALALETRADLVLLDESAARLKARQLGLTHTGVLGVLRQARRTNRIPSLKAEILRLRTNARFFVGPALEKKLLSSVGE